MDLSAYKTSYQDDNKACGALCTLVALHAKGKIAKMPENEDKDPNNIWGKIKFGDPNPLGLDGKESSPLKILEVFKDAGISASMVLDQVTYFHSMGLHSGLKTTGENFINVIQTLPSSLQPKIVTKWENSITLKTDELYMLTVIIVDDKNKNMPTDLTHWILASSSGGDVQIYDPAGNSGSNRVKTFGKTSFKSLLQGIGHFDVGQRYVFSGLAIKVA